MAETAARLFKIRHLLGICGHSGQLQFSDALGEEPGLYGASERGQGKPPIEAIGLVIDKFLPDLTLDYLYRGVEGRLTTDLMLRLREAPDRPGFTEAAQTAAKQPAPQGK